MLTDENSRMTVESLIAIEFEVVEPLTRTLPLIANFEFVYP
jgi:hypothetical protein